VCEAPVKAQELLGSDYYNCWQ